jgi:uncharacterized protein GlcG (DUF336 family)
MSASELVLYDTQMVTTGGGVPIEMGDEVVGGVAGLFPTYR